MTKSLDPKKRENNSSFLPSDSWIALNNDANEPVGALVPLNKEDSQKFRAMLALETLDNRYRLRQAQINSVIADHIGWVTASVGTALKSGQVFQVTGPAHLVSGLTMGTHAMLRSQGGLLGTVVKADSGTIAGQLRFMPKSKASMVAPLLAYQVLQAVVGTLQLQEISKKLDSIQQSLNRLHERHEAEVMGRILWAISTLDDLFDEYRNTGEFSSEMILRLSHTEMTIGSLFERNQLLMEIFREKFNNISSQTVKQGVKEGAKAASSLLIGEGHQASKDMEVLVALAAADLRVQDARIRCAMQHSPADIKRRITRAEEKVTKYCELLKNIPSIEAVAKHAQSCIDQMSWFSRLISNRGIISKVKEAKSLDIKDIRPAITSSEEISVSYAIWLDEKGVAQASIINEKMLEEIPNKASIDSIDQEFNLTYPVQWEAEYKLKGFVQEWRYHFPGLFKGCRRSSCRDDLDFFTKYALMYLLRRDREIHSITNYKISDTAGIANSKCRVHRHWKTMQKLMGKNNFISLQKKLREGKVKDSSAEPVLFCWDQIKKSWFFAETRGRDKMAKSQQDWHRIYSEVFSNAADIKFYRLVSSANKGTE